MHSFIRACWDTINYYLPERIGLSVNGSRRVSHDIPEPPS